MLLLHDSVGRARATWAPCPAGPWSPGRKRAAAGASHPRAGGLRQAWRHFRQYRRAVARAAADED